MRIRKRDAIIVEVIAAVLILVFTYTAVNKLTESNIFRIQLLYVPILKDFRDIIVWLLPAFELIIVILLTIKQTRYQGLLLSMWTLTTFTLYLGISLLFETDLPCHCGGIINFLSWEQHTLLNLLLTLLAWKGSLLFKKIKYGIPQHTAAIPKK